MSLVECKDFNAKHLGGSELIPQQIKKPTESISYNEIKLNYNYGTPERPIINDLYLELPETTSTGIRTKEEDALGQNGPYKRKSHSLMITFDLANPNPEKQAEMEMAIMKLDELHAQCCYLLAPYKGKAKMHDFDPNRPGGMFKNPVYWPRDEQTGEKIKGKNPNIWVKLREWKNSKALFTDPQGQLINWDLLRDVDITFVPLLHVEKIYIGAKASLQISLASAVVTKIVKAGSETRQLSTLERLKQKYGEGLSHSVEAQLADLRMSRQETLQNVAQNNEFGNRDEGVMHKLNDSTESTNLQNFLAAPPPNMSSTFTVPNLPSVTSTGNVNSHTSHTQMNPPIRIKLN